jgi:chromosome segregation ATPase
MLQESNKKLIQENKQLKTEIEEALKEIRKIENSYKEDKEKWQKELLATLAQSSQREQILKTQIDTKQKEVLELRDALNKSEIANARLKGDVQVGEVRLEGIQKKVDQLNKELSLLKDTYEKNIKKEQEVNIELSAKLNRTKIETSDIIRNLETVTFLN